MARLPRLVLTGHAHCVIQRGHSGRPVFVDAEDRASFLDALRQAAAQERVLVHAYALLPTEVQLLATPPVAPALGRMVQALGRRYVSAYNRRHARSGTLWDGRFRCGAVEPGALRLAAMCLIDGQSAEPGITSAAHRNGAASMPWLSDPPEFWLLGNTPFEREAAYRARLADGVSASLARSLREAALGGWVSGSPSFVAQVATAAARPTRPRTRGRPRRRPDDGTAA